jgi:hypothetical protein
VPRNAYGGNALLSEGEAMIIFELSDGIVIKRTVDSMTNVCINQNGDISLWGSKTRLGHRKATKPYCEYDINECRDLLKELGRLEAADDYA